MSKPPRVSKSPSELRAELRDQMRILQSECAAFDGGLEAMAKRIATTLRILIHETRTSRALLGQLGLRTARFYDSAGPLNDKSLLPEMLLIAFEFHEGEVRYVAPGDGKQSPPRLVSFPDWWGAPVLKDSSGNVFSRRQLVLHVADTDGGAHVDDALEAPYHALSRLNSLGWRVRGGKPPKGQPELVSIRQIAYEVTWTIQRKAPWALDAQVNPNP